MANTTWSTTDKGSAGIVLSGGNLVTTTSSTAVGAGIRSLDKQVAGTKFYYEIAFTTVSNQLVGIASAAASMAVGNNYLAMINVSNAGVLNINNVGSGTILSAFTAGQVCCIAVDRVLDKVWFRNGAAGSWNGNAAHDPAIGAGGFSLRNAGISPVVPVYACAVYNTSATSSVFTANFGDTAFVGAVPSGFTAGFTAGASPVVNAITPGVIRETLYAQTNSLLRVSGLVRETLRTTGTGGATTINVDGVVREVLRAQAAVVSAQQSRVMVMA